MSQYENIANGYVSNWKWKEIIKSPPYEEDSNDIDIHNPMYSTNYEHVSNLVVPSVFLQTCFIFIFSCLHIYLFIVSIICVHL